MMLQHGMVGAGGVDVGDIKNSLRCRSAASAYLSRTITTDATSTYFAAIKRGKLGVISPIFDTNIKFNANDTLTAFGLTTTAVFRDPTSWLFIHVSNGGLYVNGVSYGAVTTSAITNPRIGFDGTNYFDGYIARIGVVGGSSSSYTNFGYFNTQINEWVTKSQAQVKAVVDAGGTNSFMLDFDNGTSLTTLGYDKSSKANNWTLNNFSLTAGSTYDWMLDVPGNSYATLNPLRGTGGTLSAGNLTFTNWTASHQAAVVTQAVTSGKWYAEGALTAIPTGAIIPGIGIRPITAGNVASGEFAGSIAGSFGGVCGPTNMVPYSGGVAGTAMAATITSTSVAHVALDVSAGKVWIGIDGAWIGGGDPAAGTLPTYTFTAGTGFEVYCSAYATVMNLLCGQAPLHTAAVYAGAALGYFRYTPPTGYKALCQANLPTPAILNPELHMDIKLHVGNGTSQNITGVAFAPDLVWYKSRSNAINNVLTDSIRGASKQLYSDATAAEGTDGNSITSLNSGGFSVGPSSTINTNGATYVDWLWKAGGAAVTNNAGSISSQVSANVDAGFSIVTYTGTGANATVGHGLGVAPKMVIIKNRTAAWNWVVLHGSLSATQYLSLNSTSAAATDATMWNSTTPTSTVFSLGTNGNSNAASANVAYCFAEIEGFSKIFSYTGNGSTDGPFVECGFKPKFVMIKRTDTAGSWQMFDSLRAGYNVDNDQLVANTTAAEATADLLDFTATGFKPRSANAEVNTSGGTYIFIAFADVPAKYSLAR